MKILHLYTNLNITCGISSVINNIVLFDSADKFEHIVAVTGGDAVNCFREKGINVKLLGFGKNKIFFAVLVIRLIMYCRKNKIDIIHSHHRYMDLISVCVRYFCRVRLITTVHSIVEGKKILSYKISEIVAVSNSVRRYLIEYFKVPGEKIRVIHNSVAFSPVELEPLTSQLKEELNIAPDKKILGYIGRFDLDKGVDVLLKTVKQLKSIRNDFVLMMIGTGFQREWVVQFIEDNSLPVIVLPPQTSILKYFKLADIIVIPSRVDTFPMAMLESGLMQKAVIGSRVYGIPELIEHNTDGLLVDSGDVDGFSAAIQLLMDNDGFREELAVRLFNKVKQYYLAEHKIPLYNKLYKEVY